MAVQTPQQANAYTQLTALFKSYGLESLAPTILTLLQDGYTQQNAMFELENNPKYNTAWNARFAGNVLRQKNGIAPLDPATYLSTEAAYRQVLQANGLPKGFYDQHSDFAAWIGNDVSPNEINDRASIAAEWTNSTDPAEQQALLNYEGIDKGHIAAYALDQERSLPLLKQQAAQVQIGAAGLRQGYQVNAADAMRYASMGVDANQAQTAFQKIGEVLPEAQKLGQIYQQPNMYTQQTAQEEFLGGNASAARARQQLFGEETAQFAQGSGATKNTLEDSSVGSF